MLDSSSLVERLRTLEREKAALLEENGNQRLRFERCLNDVTSHVIQVLLAQKVSKSLCVYCLRVIFVLSSVLMLPAIHSGSVMFSGRPSVRLSRGGFKVKGLLGH